MPCPPGFTLQTSRPLSASETRSTKSRAVDASRFRPDELGGVQTAPSWMSILCCSFKVRASTIRIE
jgi:hypothetical protein